MSLPAVLHASMFQGGAPCQRHTSTYHVHCARPVRLSHRLPGWYRCSGVTTAQASRCTLLLYRQQEQLKKSGLGHVIMFLSKLPDELPANRRMARDLVEKWSRPIFEQYRNDRCASRKHDAFVCSELSATLLLRALPAAAAAQSATSSSARKNSSIAMSTANCAAREGWAAPWFSAVMSKTLFSYKRFTHRCCSCRLRDEDAAEREAEELRTQMQQSQKRPAVEDPERPLRLGEKGFRHVPAASSALCNTSATRHGPVLDNEQEAPERPLRLGEKGFRRAPRTAASSCALQSMRGQRGVVPTDGWRSSRQSSLPHTHWCSQCAHCASMLVRGACRTATCEMRPRTC